jgi:hypothetical protein
MREIGSSMQHCTKILLFIDRHVYIKNLLMQIFGTAHYLFAFHTTINLPLPLFAKEGNKSSLW